MGDGSVANNSLPMLSLCALNLYFINYSQIPISQNFKINWNELELSGNQEIGSRKQSTENKGKLCFYSYSLHFGQMKL